MTSRLHVPGPFRSTNLRTVAHINHQDISASNQSGGVLRLIFGTEAAASASNFFNDVGILLSYVWLCWS